MMQFHKLGKKAINTYASREFDNGRYKNFRSAEATIRDACSRRLKPQIDGINSFDKAAKLFLEGERNLLEEILFEKAEGRYEKNLVDDFIYKSKHLEETPVAVDFAESIETQRIKTHLYRIPRDTNLSRKVKVIHGYRCQLCNKTLILSNNIPYAEVHHIMPLGEPHGGPDSIENVICVCPNCHVLLDYGAIELNRNIIKRNTMHSIPQEFFDYHNSTILIK